MKTECVGLHGGPGLVPSGDSGLWVRVEVIQREVVQQSVLVELQGVCRVVPRGPVREEGIQREQLVRGRVGWGGECEVVGLCRVGTDGWEGGEWGRVYIYLLDTGLIDWYVVYD